MPITRQGTNNAMTPESIQAMIDRAIQRNSTQDDDSQNLRGGIRRHVQPARVCTYPDFMKCQPLNFKGTEGVIGLNQWLEKMESVFYIIGCAIENQVKFATCTLLGAALTWWNGHVRTLGHDAAYAMTWGTFKKKLSNKYYPNGEIKKLKIELWNLKVKGNDVAAYTQRFQELALMCTKFLADETANIDKGVTRMMTSIEEVNLRVSYQVQARKRESEDFYTQLLDARTDRRDIRLEVDVVRGLAGVRHIMRTHVLEARAQIDTVEDTGSSFIISICIDIVIISHVHCVLVIIRIMPITRQGTNDAMTPESIQAMIDRAIQRNSTQDDDSQNSGGGIRRPVQPARVCTYPDFMKCQPLNFKGTEGVVGLNQWLEKMESVFHISGCAVENQVKFATCTLLGAALTWWNGHVRTLGHDAAYAMTWGTFKKKLSDKYCPNGEIKKLEIELWNLKVKGNDVAAYTQRFQELALMCTKFLADETAKIDKYIGGLPDNIHGNVMSARPKTLDFAIELANDLMDQKLRTYAERQNENKRKADDSSRNNHQQQSHKRQNVARAYTAGPGEKKVYTGDLPLCTKCNYHHTGQSQEYLSKGCDLFLAHITTKEVKDKSKEKRLEDVPIIRNFPEVFPEDLPGIPLTRQVEFQIDLVPGAAPVARTPYRLAPSEMKELAEQLQ
ncbi:putative reverse transcriptase domain-containing protein, partial [Tanacetum coccineum]